MKSIQSSATPGTFEQRYGGRSRHPRPWSAEASAARHDKIDGIAVIALGKANIMVSDPQTGEVMPYESFAKRNSRAKSSPIVQRTQGNIVQSYQRELIEITMEADISPQLKVQLLKHLGYTALAFTPKVPDITPSIEAHKQEQLVAG